MVQTINNSLQQETLFQELLDILNSLTVSLCSSDHCEELSSVNAYADFEEDDEDFDDFDDEDFEDDEDDEDDEDEDDDF